MRTKLSLPVATTMPTPLPSTMLLPMKIMLEASRYVVVSGWGSWVTLWGEREDVRI